MCKGQQRDNQQQEMKKEQFNNLFANNLKRRANYYIFIAYKKEIVSISLRFSHFFILLNVISVETHTQVAEILLLGTRTKYKQSNITTLYPVNLFNDER